MSLLEYGRLDFILFGGLNEVDVAGAIVICRFLILDSLGLNQESGIRNL